MNRLIDLYYKNNTNNKQQLSIDLFELSKISTTNKNFFNIDIYVDDALVSNLNDSSIINTLNSFYRYHNYDILEGTEVFIEVKSVSNEYIVNLFDFNEINLEEFFNNYPLSLTNEIPIFSISYIRPIELVINVSDVLLVKHLARALKITNVN